MTLTSMAMSKAEQKKDSSIPTTAESKKYPWGLSVTLDDVALKKLGREREDFKSDGYVFLVCKAKCASIHTNEEGGKEDVSIHLQIEAMKRFSNG